MLTEAEVEAKVAAREQFRTPQKASPPPHRISVGRYGQHASYVRDGERVWGFDTKEGRDRFAADYVRHAVVLDVRVRSGR